jgi:Site-specific recombinase XerD
MSQNTRQEERQIWLTPKEMNQLILSAPSNRDKLIMQLGSQCGLRISETRTLRVDDLIEREVENDLKYFATIRNGKDTTGDGGHTREIWIPKDTWSTIRLVINEYNLQKQHYLVPSRNGGGLSDTGARNIVKKIGERAFESNNNNNRYQYVSSHDLRRYWAHQLLVEHGLNTRIVMSLGGWRSFNSLKPYLDKPTPQNISTEMDKADWT